MNYQLSTINYQLIIIGAGPAGISAAFEAQRLNLNYLVHGEKFNRQHDL